MSNPLKLMAMDVDDLNVISACVQDGIIKSSEIDYNAKTQQLVIPLNRFAWESPASRRWFFKKHERRRSVLHFERVEAMRSKLVNQSNEDEVLSLLTMNFSPKDEAANPSGTIELIFSAGARIAFDVECIEARLSDLGAAWSTANKPRHRAS